MAPNRAEGQELPHDQPLTQYGEQLPLGTGFRDRLRTAIGETEISMILGEVDATAAAMLVTHHLVPFAIRRGTTVGRLRSEGFKVVHSPTRGNPLHVSVFPPIDHQTGEPIAWQGELAQRFNACFTEGATPPRRRKR